MIDYHGLWTMMAYHGLSWTIDYDGLLWMIMDSGLSWYYHGFWTLSCILHYHDISWISVDYGLSWTILDYHRLLWAIQIFLDHHGWWIIVDYRDYRGLLRMIVNYPDYRELWIIMVHMIFIENWLPISELYLEAIFWWYFSMGSGPLPNPCGGASIKWTPDRGLLEWVWRTGACSNFRVTR